MNNPVREKSKSIHLNRSDVGGNSRLWDPFGLPDKHPSDSRSEGTTGNCEPDHFGDDLTSQLSKTSAVRTRKCLRSGKRGSHVSRQGRRADQKRQDKCRQAHRCSEEGRLRRFAEERNEIARRLQFPVRRDSVQLSLARRVHLLLRCRSGSPETEVC